MVNYYSALITLGIWAQSVTHRNHCAIENGDRHDSWLEHESL